MPEPFFSRAQRLLGYVACSAMPLTVAEAEQLLCMSPGNMTAPPRIIGNLDVVKLCGPIVEAIDDYVFFVHFTVKE
jgi:hypothetical protein